MRFWNAKFAAAVLLAAELVLPATRGLLLKEDMQSEAPGDGVHTRTPLQAGTLCYMGSCEPSSCFGPPSSPSLSSTAALSNSSSWWPLCRELTDEVENGNICGAYCSDGLIGSYVFICWHGVWSGPYGGCWQSELGTAAVTAVATSNSGNNYVSTAALEPLLSSNTTAGAPSATPVVCAGLPTAAPPEHSRGWPSVCDSDSYDGYLCAAPCDNAAGYVGTVVSLCHLGKWMPTYGACVLSTCWMPPLPLDATEYSTGWEGWCSIPLHGTRDGDPCFASCIPGWNGLLISLCRQGHWTPPFGSCVKSNCLGRPTPDPENSIGWASGCGQDAFTYSSEGFMCTADCKYRYAPGAVLTMCMQGEWQKVSGDCSDDPVPPEEDGPPCSGTPEGGNLANSKGWITTTAAHRNPVVAVCEEGYVGEIISYCVMGQYQKPYGSCEPSQCLDQPHVPLPAYAQDTDWAAGCAGKGDGGYCPMGCQRGFSGSAFSFCERGMWTGCQTQGACNPLSDHPCIGAGACGNYGGCVDGSCQCKHDWTGTHCEVAPQGPTNASATVCKQVNATFGAVVYSRPCGCGSLLKLLPYGQTVLHVKPPADLGDYFLCPDGSCWIEVILEGKRGAWLKAADRCKCNDMECEGQPPYPLTVTGCSTPTPNASCSQDGYALLRNGRLCLRPPAAKPGYCLQGTCRSGSVSLCSKTSPPGKCVPEYECSGNVQYKSSSGVRLCPSPTVCCLPATHQDGASCTGTASGKPGTCRRRYIKAVATGKADKDGALNCVDGTWDGKCTDAVVRFDQWGLRPVQYVAELHCCVPSNQSLTPVSACPSLMPGNIVKFNDTKQLMCAVVYNSKKVGLALNEQWAYILATAQHESGFKFTLGVEGWNALAKRYTGLFKTGAYNKIDEALRLHTRYYPYVGRGFVQLTWARNYAALQEELHCPLMAAPQLALRPDIAMHALVSGMASGRYDSSKRTPCRGTGLSGYINSTSIAKNLTEAFTLARCTVNVQDNAAAIAASAQTWLAEILKANVGGDAACTP